MSDEPSYATLKVQFDEFVNEHSWAAMTGVELDNVLDAALARDLIELSERLDFTIAPHLDDFTLAHWPAARDFIERTRKRLITPTEGDL